MSEDNRFTDEATKDWRALVERRLNSDALHLEELSRKVECVKRTVETQAESIDSIRGELSENSRTTLQVKEDTQTIVEFTRNLDGAVRLAEVCAKVAKPLTAIVIFGGALAACWEWVKHFFK